MLLNTYDLISGTYLLLLLTKSPDAPSMAWGSAFRLAECINP